jgi:uncharacterized protein (DUF1330 family)
MLTRIRPGRVVSLARRDLPQPLDVINLITPRRFESYRWYGLLVMPVMTLVGGRLLWMGRLDEPIAGERQAEKLLIVRYPSHRHFLAMTLNPYYLAINRFREAGVKRFEASFTHASVSDDGLARRRRLVAVHFNSRPGEDALAAVREIVEPVSGELVYATRTVASLGILDPPADTDPNPLTLGELALFAAPEGDLAEDALAALAPELAAVTGDFSLQVYRREPRSVYRPSFRPAPAAASEATPA